MKTSKLLITKSKYFDINIHEIGVCLQNSIYKYTTKNANECPHSTV